jgi:hypothetical protein
VKNSGEENPQADNKFTVDTCSIQQYTAHLNIMAAGIAYIFPSKKQQK